MNTLGGFAWFRILWTFLDSVLFPDVCSHYSVLWFLQFQRILLLFSRTIFSVSLSPVAVLSMVGDDSRSPPLRLSGRRTFGLCLRSGCHYFLFSSCSGAVVSVPVISVTRSRVRLSCSSKFNRLFGFLFHFSFEQTHPVSFLSCSWQYLKGTFSTDCYQIGGEVLVRRVRNMITQNISPVKVESAVLCFQFDFVWKEALSFHIAVQLIVETTL